MRKCWRNHGVLPPWIPTKLWSLVYLVESLAALYLPRLSSPLLLTFHQKEQQSFYPYKVLKYILWLKSYCISFRQNQSTIIFNFILHACSQFFRCYRSKLILTKIQHDESCELTSGNKYNTIISYSIILHI
jgi:hypothetical protein